MVLNGLSYAKGWRALFQHVDLFLLWHKLAAPKRQGLGAVLGAATCCKTYGCACCADAGTHVRAQSLAANEMTTRCGIPQPCHIVLCVGCAAGRHCRDNRCDCCVSLRLCLGLCRGPRRGTRVLLLVVVQEGARIGFTHAVGIEHAGSLLFLRRCHVLHPLDLCRSRGGVASASALVTLARRSRRLVSFTAFPFSFGRGCCRDVFVLFFLFFLVLLVLLLLLRLVGSPFWSGVGRGSSRNAGLVFA